MADVYLRAGCTLAFEPASPAPMVVMLRPRSDRGQWVRRQTYQLTPRVGVTETTDQFGNLVQRMVAPAGPFEIRTESEVLISAPPPGDARAGFTAVPDLPDAALIYLLPSRYCESDRFGDMAWQIVQDTKPGYPQVATITQWVREHVRNVPLSSTYAVSAVEVNQRREGVCRDLAQLGITLCRAICIPARLVVGYLHALEPMDIHAWFEAYIGGEWITFDPAVPDTQAPRIVIARGRDATDVAIYNQYGPLLLPTAMHVSVEVI